MSIAISKNNRSITQVLLAIAEKLPKSSKLTYNDLLKLLGSRAFGIAIILFALPSALPFSFIPGISFIFSIPIAFFALQMLFLKQSIWLPQVLGEQEVNQYKLASIIKKCAPYFAKIDHLLKPRWEFFLTPWMRRLNGLVLLFLSLLLTLPIPFSNLIFATIIILFGLGTAEHDGLVIALAYIYTVIYFIAISIIVWGVLDLIKSSVT